MKTVQILQVTPSAVDQWIRELDQAKTSEGVRSTGVVACEADHLEMGDDCLLLPLLLLLLPLLMAPHGAKQWRHGQLADNRWLPYWPQIQNSLAFIYNVKSKEQNMKSQRNVISKYRMWFSNYDTGFIGQLKTWSQIVTWRFVMQHTHAVIRLWNTKHLWPL